MICEIQSLFLQCRENHLCMDVYHKQWWKKCLSNLLHLERFDGMIKVISDIMAHWYRL